MLPTRPPDFTPRLQIGLGFLAFGVGLMFFWGKVAPTPFATGIALGIALALVGVVLTIMETVRDPREPESTPDRSADEP